MLCWFTNQFKFCMSMNKLEIKGATTIKGTYMLTLLLALFLSIQ
jgi:hypothetical protein